MDLALIIIGIFLIIFAVIDWKVKSIPSIFLTAILFAIAFLNPANLWFGAMAFIMAYLLFEANFYQGVADIKIMAMLGFLISTTSFMLLYIGLVVVFGTAWIILIKWRMSKEKETAFVPVFVFVYLAMILMGGIS